MDILVVLNVSDDVFKDMGFLIVGDRLSFCGFCNIV